MINVPPNVAPSRWNKTAPAITGTRVCSFFVKSWVLSPFTSIKLCKETEAIFFIWIQNWSNAAERYCVLYSGKWRQWRPPQHSLQKSKWKWSKITSSIEKLGQVVKCLYFRSRIRNIYPFGLTFQNVSRNLL